MATTKKLHAVSMGRYNGGVRAKRQYGSATITKFAVFWEGDERNAVEVEVGGRTPGERMTAAKEKALPLLEKKLAGSIHES